MRNTGTVPGYTPGLTTGYPRGGVAQSLAAAGGGGVATAATIPMAPHRRLRQAVLLAHKLLKKEGELEVARRELADLQSRWAFFFLCNPSLSAVPPWEGGGGEMALRVWVPGRVSVPDI